MVVEWVVGFVFEDVEGCYYGFYDCFVNVMWESWFVFDVLFGIELFCCWLYCYKLVFYFKGIMFIEVLLMMMVFGVFGDVVNFGDGIYYLSWYLEGKIGESCEVEFEEWEE